MNEIHPQEISIIKRDIEDADSIEELQSSVLLINETLSSKEGDVELSALGDGHTSRLDTVVECMDAIRSRLDELSDEQNISSYSVSLGGNLTGPSISITVTSEVK